MITLIGLAALRLGFTDVLLFYVRARMRLPMVLAGVVLVATGVLTAWPRHGSGISGHTPRAAWLLLVPIAALVVFTPGPLGADASVPSGAVVFDPAAEYPPLATPRSGPVEMTLSEFWERVRFDPHHSVRAVPVRVVAFVVVDGNTQRLGRYLISCCAADATLLTVDVASWPSGMPANGQWVDATIREPAHGLHGNTITVDVLTATDVSQPSDPYLAP